MINDSIRKGDLKQQEKLELYGYTDKRKKVSIFVEQIDTYFKKEAYYIFRFAYNLKSSNICPSILQSKAILEPPDTPTKQNKNKRKQEESKQPVAKKKRKREHK